ncbi:MAG: undecaprenyl/decaprenyl-phosphate alpha-N-acetylglucosaminyl 1-phosphate transferase [Flavobacteriales bacterium]|nr:undecaprenyl/decaprenyl-phosphate alpha-N-acetylglucosaminyl 1-phosphate transferase [Flavobacteriales bacterium]MCB9449232.1 undecaprenyl/decaprenyl-phosphate alpha-N-acetylglucosaminyl 1-phosphate transferase [Flavobacteriales bacterium]
MDTVIFSFVTSFIVVLFATPPLITVAKMKNLVDEPNDERKLHKSRIPTIGGIIIFAAALFAFALWFPAGKIDTYKELLESTNDLKYIVATIILLFFIGIKDDIIGTAPMKKLIAHIIVGLVLVLMANVRLTSMYGLFGVYELPDWASIILSLFTYIVIVNAFNLIDGVDGLAAGVGFIVCLSFGIWFFLVGDQVLTALSFSLGGALLGFLIFNFYPAKIFMGDSGSLTIGLIVSILAIKLIEYDTSTLQTSFAMISKPVFVIAVLMYPLFDTLRIFIYRAINGNSPFAADKNHIHHRLIDTGLTQRQTTLLIYIVNVCLIFVAIFMAGLDPSVALILLAVVAAALVFVPLLLRKRSVKFPKPQAS